MSGVSRQLPLELKLPVKASLNDYLASDRDVVIASLNNLLANNTENLLYLAGSTGCGKSHLLSAACQLASQRGLSIIYLPMKQHRDFIPQICEGLEQAELVCIDDIDQVAGLADWEQALFHLFNRLRDGQRKLVVTGQVSAANLEIKLPDLKSRLGWGVSHTLKALDDEEKKQLLQQHSAQQGMELPDDTASYLMNHHSRQTGDLLQALDKLERASMAAQRKLTIPFVKQILGNH